MGTLTITTSAQHDTRIVAALGKHLNLGRNATGAEVKAWIVNYLKAMVLEQEKLAAAVAAVATVTEINPT